MSDDTENELVSCVSCSTQYERDDGYMTSDGDFACSDCFRTCERCEHASTDSDSWYTVSDEMWCEGCWENNSFYCERCEDNFNDDRVSWNEVNGNRWCEYCCSDYATWCEGCDEYFDDDAGMCPNCERVGIVHDYNYKPNAVFHGDTKTGLYMGFELEMELNAIGRVEYNEAATLVTEIEQANIAYLKRDGSIFGNGFELVTHPHTLGAYENASDLWEYIETLRTTYKARSWDTESCGLHVHVSRAAFKSGAHTHRFLALIYKNPKEMMKLAGRQNSKYAKFSDVYVPDEWGVPRFTLKDKMHGRHGSERYSAVNTNNYNTLELRFFRGNMKREGVMTALELCHASVEYTRDLSVSDVKLGMLSWEWFADWVAANNGIYPNLYLRMSKVPSVNLKTLTLINA